MTMKLITKRGNTQASHPAIFHASCGIENTNLPSRRLFSMLVADKILGVIYSKF
jgi:hypothetical protein